MKSIFSVMTAVVFVLYSSLAAAASVRVVSLKGSLTGRAQDAAEGPLVLGDVVGSGWMVNTGPDSYAVLRFDDGQLVALQSSTTFRIDSYKYEQASPGTGQVLLSLLKGGLRAISGLVVNTNRSAFALRTSTATIGIRGTDLMTVSFQGTYTQVLSGSVSVTTSAGTGLASAGETMLAASSTALPVTVHPAAYPSGLFLELQGIPMPLPAPVAVAGGSAAGAGAPAAARSGDLTAAFVFLGLFAVGAIAAVAAGGDGDGSSATTATTHH